MIIPDPDLDFFYPFRIQNPGVKNIGNGNLTHNPRSINMKLFYFFFEPLF
jgi:hypothetical protein